jgi:membrane associated rhomboid family serine protease
MIPLKDDNPQLTTPLLNYFLILANVLVFAFELSMDRRSEKAFAFTFGLIPGHVTSALSGALAGGHARVPPIHLSVALLPILTSMFVHAGFFHVLFNMWFLWVFGGNVEDALGHFGYLVFYLVCGVAAALAQILSNPGSMIPTVGACGAIAGVMGGYFVLYPRARVLMLVPFIFIFFLWLPAWVVLGYWFVLQFLSGLGSSLVGAGQGGVAFWAHVGGFVAGVLLVKLFPAQTRRYRY